MLVLLDGLLDEYKLLLGVGECLLIPPWFERLGLLVSLGDKEAKCCVGIDEECPNPWRAIRLFVTPWVLETKDGGGFDAGGGILRLPGGNTFFTFFPMYRPPGLISLVLWDARENIVSFIRVALYNT